MRKPALKTDSSKIMAVSYFAVQISEHQRGLGSVQFQTWMLNIEETSEDEDY